MYISEDDSEMVSITVTVACHVVPEQFILNCCSLNQILDSLELIENPDQSEVVSYIHALLKTSSSKSPHNKAKPSVQDEKSSREILPQSVCTCLPFLQVTKTNYVCTLWVHLIQLLRNSSRQDQLSNPVQVITQHNANLTNKSCSVSGNLMKPCFYRIVRR